MLEAVALRSGNCSDEAHSAALDGQQQDLQTLCEIECQHKHTVDVRLNLRALTSGPRHFRSYRRSRKRCPLLHQSTCSNGKRARLSLWCLAGHGQLLLLLLSILSAALPGSVNTTSGRGCQTCHVGGSSLAIDTLELLERTPSAARHSLSALAARLATLLAR